MAGGPWSLQTDSAAAAAAAVEQVSQRGGCSVSSRPASATRELWAPGQHIPLLAPGFLRGTLPEGAVAAVLAWAVEASSTDSSNHYEREPGSGASFWSQTDLDSKPNALSSRASAT